MMPVHSRNFGGINIDVEDPNAVPPFELSHCISDHYRRCLSHVSVITASAQENVWTANYERKENITKNKAAGRQSFPTDFKLFDLNMAPLRQQLFTIVDTKIDASKQQSIVVSVPNADGEIELFELFEASNFDPELQARFPEIRAYSGRGVSDAYATIKLSFSPQGVQGTVFRNGSDFFSPGGQTEIIEPYSADGSVYAVFRADRKSGELPWSCTTQEQALFSEWKSNIAASDALLSSEGNIRTLRLAQSVNAEYSIFFGATAPAAIGPGRCRDQRDTNAFQRYLRKRPWRSFELDPPVNGALVLQSRNRSLRHKHRRVEQPTAGCDHCRGHHYRGLRHRPHVRISRRWWKRRLYWLCVQQQSRINAPRS